MAHNGLPPGPTKESTILLEGERALFLLGGSTTSFNRQRLKDLPPFSVRDAGSLPGGIHPQHLHPRHGRDGVGYGGNHWDRRQRRYVTCIKKSTAKSKGKHRKISSGRKKFCPLLSDSLCSASCMARHLDTKIPSSRTAVNHGGMTTNTRLRKLHFYNTQILF